MRTLLIAAVAVFALASCKKDYDCECTTASGSKVTYPLGKRTKKTAKTACSLNELGGYSCDLK